MKKTKYILFLILLCTIPGLTFKKVDNRFGMPGDFLSTLQGKRDVTLPTFAVKLYGDADKVASELGLVNKGPIGELDGWYEFEGVPNASTLKHVDIEIAEPLQKHYMRRTATDPLYSQQWHLENTGQYLYTVPGNDVNIEEAWNAGASGKDVLIQIVDDGLLYTHSDLTGKYVSAASYDINGGDSNPTPSAGDTHGSQCAGVALAARDNGVCGAGAAYDAKVAGIRLLAAGFTAAQSARAYTTYTINQGVGISSNSWGSTDTGNTYYAADAVFEAAREAAATTGRGGRGVVITFSAGNSALDNEDCNYSEFATSPYIITVGASNANGTKSIYSESCAALFINAPSNDLRDYMPGITTLTSTSNTACSDDFGGTSSAAPLVSGIAALILSVNPTLTYRDVMHILAQTSTKNEMSDPLWTTNAAGLSHNPKYGFGRANAGAAVNAAKTWSLVGPVSKVTGTVAPAATLTENIAISSSIPITSSLSAESINVYVDITHPYPNELEIILTGPSGTSSVLATPRNTGVNLIINFGQLNWFSEYTSFSPRPSTPITVSTVQSIFAYSCTDFRNALDTQLTSFDGIVIIVDSICPDDGTLVSNLESAGAKAVLYYRKSSITGTSGSTIPSASAVSFFVETVISLSTSAWSFNSVQQQYGPITLTSTKMPSNADLSGGYRFLTVRNWKENISGNWQLQVTDKVTGDTGTLNNWKIEIFAYDPTVNGTVIATTGTIPDADSLATKSFVNYAMMIAVALFALLL